MVDDDELLRLRAEVRYLRERVMRLTQENSSLQAFLSDKASPRQLSYLKTLLDEWGFVLATPMDQLPIRHVAVLITCLKDHTQRFPPEVEPLLHAANWPEPTKATPDDPFSATVPPQCIEAEMDVVTAMLMDWDCCNAVLDQLTTEDFYSDRFRTIFQIAQTLRLAGQPVDLLSVLDEMHVRGISEEMGGLPFISSLIQQAPNELTKKETLIKARFVYCRAVQRKNWGRSVRSPN